MYFYIIILFRFTHIIVRCEYNHNVYFHNTSLYFYQKYKELICIISYNPLWKTMEEKGVSQYLLLKSGIDNRTLDSLKKNKNITLLTVEKLCNIIGCSPNDIVEFIE